MDVKDVATNLQSLDTHREVLLSRENEEGEELGPLKLDDQRTRTVVLEVLARQEDIIKRLHRKINSEKEDYFCPLTVTSWKRMPSW